MTGQNSYAENIATLTRTTKEILALANAMNESVTGNDASIYFGDGITLPSYTYILKELQRMNNTVAAFTQGKGVVETDDGTYRKIKVDNISRPASDIVGLKGITKFNIDPNWFFELLQYPRCIVKVDLTDTIDPDSDRVLVTRVIIDVDQERMTDDMRSQILASNLAYGDMIEFLDTNLIEYKEDRDEVKLPLTYEKYYGQFPVINSALIRNPVTGVSENWYYLSNINYSTVDENGIIKDSGNVLTNGDYLRFNNSLFKVREINQTEKRVRLEYSVGYETIGNTDVLEFYNQPFSEKVINVGIGANEVDIIYVKGVNENYNLISRNWSNPIIFFTNDLTFEDDDNKKFISYYTENVADFGARWIAEAKEGHISAYDGVVPNSPVLDQDGFRVVQINTQLDVTLDDEAYKNLTSEIASTKSNISATRNTIAANKDKLVKESDNDRREIIQNTINADTDKLNNLTTQFSSLVEELNTLLTNAGAIGYSPKYHIMGYFSIPEPQYVVNNVNGKYGKQSIIGFETLYRYLHVDETGKTLNSFDYTDVSTGTVMTSVFTDWNLSVSPFLEKKYDEDSDTYVWVGSKVDGTEIEINQIDIPIRSGEKVEFKVRSISEAGYPYSPLKSEWSNSVIIGFPDNLTTDDSVTTILNTVKNDMTSVVLQETLSSAGVYSHLADSNSKYKHSADNIEYIETVYDSSGNTTIQTMSLADKIKSLTKSATIKADTPEVEFSIPNMTTGETRTGKISIHLPNDNKRRRNEAEEVLYKFFDETLIPYAKTQLR